MNSPKKTIAKWAETSLLGLALCLAALGLVGLGLSYNAPQPSPKLIRAYLLKDIQGSGSGAPVACKQVSKGIYEITIITAAHVLNNSTLLTIDEFPIFDIRKHPTLDVAICKIVASEPVEVLDLSLTERPEDGTIVVLSGYPAGIGPVSTLGLLSGNHSSANTAPGGSGGAVTTFDGKLVGILVRGYTSDGIHFMDFACEIVHFDEFRPWLIEEGVIK